MSHTLPELPYSYNALEPYISRQIMELHHKKHHQNYVNALIAAEAAYAKSSSAKERIALQAAVKFNGGGTSLASFLQLLSRLSIPFKGHINHSLFWKNLAPSASEGKGVGGTFKPGPLREAVESTFGSIDNFKKEFNTATLAIQGSGWGWLVRRLMQPANFFLKS
jgi:Fe-Mn family superoxide dismutase